jgi:hypothetical protein
VASITVARDLLCERVVRRAFSSLTLVALLGSARASFAEDPPRLVLRAGIGGYGTVVPDHFVPLGPEVLLGVTVRIWRFLSLDVEGSVIFGPNGLDAGGIPASVEGRAGLEAAFALRAAKAWLVMRATVGLLYYVDAGSAGSERYPISGREVSGRLTGGIRWPLARHFALGLEVGVSAGQLTTSLFPCSAGPCDGIEWGPSNDQPIVALDLAAVGYFPFL